MAMSICFSVRLFVGLFVRRLKRVLMTHAAAVACDRPHSCCAAHITGVSYVSSSVKNFPVKFMLAAGAYSWRPITRHTLWRNILNIFIHQTTGSKQ